MKPEPHPRAALADLEAGGISLDVFVAVQAAVAEGHALEAVLARHGLDLAAWHSADAAWATRMMESAAGDMALIDEHDRRLLAAQEAHARRVRPIDEDLAAWARFQRHLAAADDPLDALRALGLRSADLFRLHRAWTARLAAAPALRAELMALLAWAEAADAPEPLGPLEIEVPPTPLLVAPPPEPLAGAQPEEAQASPPSLFADIPVEDAAPALGAKSDVPPMPVLASPPAAPALPEMPPAAVAPARRTVTESPLLGEPAREVSVVPEVALPGSALADAPQRSPWVAPLSMEAIAAIDAVPDSVPGDTTLPIPPLDRRLAAAASPLPFKKGAPASAAALAPPPAATPPDSSARATLPPPPSEANREEARGALPFKSQAGLSPEPPQRQAAKGPFPRPELSASPGLDQTVNLTDLMQELLASLPRGVPFSAGPPAKQPPPFGGSPAGASRSRPAVSASETSLPSSFETTGEISPSDQEEIRKMVQKPLPFGPGQPASPPIPPPTPIGPIEPGLEANPDDAPTLLRQGQPKAATTREHASRRAPPNLTLEQYAGLCVELERDPAHAAEIRARYGLDDEPAWSTLYWSWKERLDHDPALQRRWIEVTAQARRRK